MTEMSKMFTGLMGGKKGGSRRKRATGGFGMSMSKMSKMVDEIFKESMKEFED